MRLYHHPLSASARRAVLTIRHLQLPVELVEIDLMNQDDRRRLGELNPNNKIPVLEDEGFVLWESGAIMHYLADRAPGQTLLPQDARARADVSRWMFWTCQHFAPAGGILAWENVWKGLVGMGPPDPAELARGNREFAVAAGVVNAHLAEREWLAGKSVSLADFTLAPSLMYTERARLPLAEYPQLAAWFERVKALDAWKATEVTIPPPP